MVMKTGREWLLVESSKLQDRRQRNCVIRNVTVLYVCVCIVWIWYVSHWWAWDIIWCQWQIQKLDKEGVLPSILPSLVLLPPLSVVLLTYFFLPFPLSSLTAKPTP